MSAVGQINHLLSKEHKMLIGAGGRSFDEVRDLVISACHPKQKQAVIDPGRRVSILTSRGCGKTTTMRARIILKAEGIPKAKCLFIATTRAMAYELFWTPYKDLCDKLGLKVSFNETKMRAVHDTTGAVVRCVGADDMREIDKLRGQPFHEVDIDEGASYPVHLLEALLFRIIGPRLGDYGGSICIGGTPGHVLAGPFYEATRPGSEIHRAYEDRNLPEYSEWVRWSSHHWNLSHGAPHIPAMQRLWDEALREKEANNWSDEHPVWKREYMGIWAADDTENVFRYRPHLEDGTPWNQWDPPKYPDGFAHMPESFDEWQYVYGMDLGHSDPYALEVFAWAPADPTKTLYHVYEFERREMTPSKIAELLVGEAKDAQNPQGCIGRTDWPSGMVADHASLGGGYLQELAEVYGIPIDSAEKKNKFDYIELFNGDLQDGRIKIMKGSRLEEQMMSLQWDIDDYGRLKEHKSMRNDCTDAAVYARRKAQHLFGSTPEEPAPYFQPRKSTVESPEEDKPRGEFDSILGDEGYYDGGSFDW